MIPTTGNYVPERILFVDPGTKDCGTAGYHARRLDRVNIHKGGKGNPFERADRIADSIALKYTQWRPQRIVFEWPRKYTSDNINPDRLMWLVWVNGLIRRIFSDVPSDQIVRVFPSEWKANASKEVIMQRAQEKLKAVELAILGDLVKDHNVVDAVYIGLDHLDRT